MAYNYVYIKWAHDFESKLYFDQAYFNDFQ